MKQVIILHGVAERNPNYAEEFIKNLRPLVAEDTVITPVFFGDLYQVAEDTFNAKLEANPLWKREHLLADRGYINQFAQDMLQIGDKDLNKKIMDRVFSSYHKLRPPVHFVTHSWGAVEFFLFNDELFNFRAVSSLTTLGCAYHLYDLGKSNPKVPNWLNVYHSVDVVGVPLSTVYGCKDVEMTDALDCIVGGEELPLALQAHNSYWASKFVAEQVAEQVNVESYQ